MEPAVGLPSNTSVATAKVSATDQIISDREIRRPLTFAASGSVSISFMTSNGCTRSNVPNANAVT